MAVRSKTSPKVLVVGAGPAGLALTITLARYGVESMLVERRTEVNQLPRATHVSTRTMELIRSWGLERRVREAAVDVSLHAWRSHTLASEDGIQIPLHSPNGELRSLSPTAPAWIPQNALEPVLLDHLQRQPKATVRLGTELAALEQDPRGITVRLRDIASEAEETVRVPYVVGADGIRSLVRDAVGIPVTGPGDLSRHSIAMFRAPLRQIVGARRYALNLITHPEADGLLLPLDRADRWGYAYEVVAERPAVDALERADVARLIATAAGAPGLDPAIEYVGSTTFGAQAADRYREGRVFLVGDAAHRLTPRGGTGMNLAIHDAFDLGWKLGWVLRGWAPPALLDLYESERRPIGLEYVLRSIQRDASERDPAAAVHADLNGRVAHAWVDGGSSEASTVDLLGDGLTRFMGPLSAPPRARRRSHGGPPVRTHRVDTATAAELGIGRAESLVVRPDGRRHAA